MNLLFRPNDASTVRLFTESGSWFAHVVSQTDIVCAHGETYTITINFKREVDAEDSDIVLDAFETALRASVAQTQEQKVQATEGVLQLLAVLIDECVYAEFTDPCNVVEP